MAFGRTLKDFFPRHVSSLLPIPDNLMSGPVKDVLQEKIRKAGGQKWSEHTKVLQPLVAGQWVQLQNLRGNHPLKSDYSGVIVGRHNENSYAVKVNGTGKVTLRNRASLRKIPPPVPIVRPVTVPSEARPASEPGSGLAVPPAPSRVTRASLKVGNLPRQNSMLQGQDEGPSQVGKVPRQGNMKPASQALHEETCEKLMRQVSDWNIPGNILHQVFHEPPPLSHYADSGGSNGGAGGSRPVSAREQPAGAGVVLESQDRSVHRSASQINTDVVQEYGQLTRPSPHRDGHLREPSPHLNNGAPPGLEKVVEVGLPDVRRSVRQRFNILPYQAGSGGMEGNGQK